MTPLTMPCEYVWVFNLTNAPEMIPNESFLKNEKPRFAVIGTGFGPSYQH